MQPRRLSESVWYCRKTLMTWWTEVLLRWARRVRAAAVATFVMLSPPFSPSPCKTDVRSFSLTRSQIDQQALITILVPTEPQFLSAFAWMSTVGNILYAVSLIMTVRFLLTVRSLYLRTQIVIRFKLLFDWLLPLTYFYCVRYYC